MSGSFKSPDSTCALLLCTVQSRGEKTQKPPQRFLELYTIQNMTQCHSCALSKARNSNPSRTASLIEKSVSHKLTMSTSLILSVARIPECDATDSHVFEKHYYGIIAQSAYDFERELESHLERHANFGNRVCQTYISDSRHGIQKKNSIHRHTAQVL